MLIAVVELSQENPLAWWFRVADTVGVVAIMGAVIWFLVYQAEKAALAEKSRMVNEELGERTKKAEMAWIEAKINEGNIALKSLQAAMKQLGGIKTSDADRGKKLAEWSDKIRYTEIQISRLSQELAQLQASE